MLTTYVACETGYNMSATMFCIDCRRSMTCMMTGMSDPAENTFMITENLLMFVRCEACAVVKGYIGSDVTRFLDRTECIGGLDTANSRLVGWLGETTLVCTDPRERPAGVLYVDSREYADYTSGGRACVQMDSNGNRIPITDFCTSCVEYVPRKAFIKSVVRNILARTAVSS